MTRFRKLVGLVALLMAFSTAAPGFSEELQGAAVVTPVYLPSEDFSPPLGTYTYDVGWQGIPAAWATITVHRDGDRYRIETRARTYSGIDWIYKMRYNATGVISSDSLTPIRSEIEHRENSRVKTTRMEYLENGQIYSVHATAGRGATVKILDTKNFTLDPFSASFLARAIDWKVGKTAHFDVYNGRSRYVISLTAESEDTVRHQGVKRDVFVIVPKVRNLMDSETSKKLRRAEIYVTNDAQREILKIKSDVFIGAVTTSLEEFQPSPRQPIVEAAARDLKATFIK